jgi:GNAT superfamily N-acetyltransferase
LMLQTVRVGVTVTFLRMERRPRPGPALPGDTCLVRLASCTVPFYRYLYGTVGADYVWWLRRTLSDAALGAILRDPEVSVHVLYRGGEPAGTFEIDARGRPAVNISYFGLLPHAVGTGMGRAFLSAAVQAAWAEGARVVTLNTCTADHPRALPNYLEAGFQTVRRMDEVWEIPTRLGLAIPRHLLV